MFTLAALLGAVLFGTAGPAGAARGSITLSVAPGPMAVLAAPCGGQPLPIDIGNTGSTGAYVDVFIEPEGPLTTSHDVISTYVPPSDDVVVTAQISAPLGSAGGTYGVSVQVGSRGPSASSSAVVTPKPSGPGANLALGGPVSASSTHGNFAVCGGVDGNTSSEDWDTLTGWNDGTSRVWPDTYAISTVGGAQPIGRVVVYTLNSVRFPAARYGLKDFDVEVLDEGGKWVNVSSVRDNTAGVVEFTYDSPLLTTGVRIVALASNNNDYSRIVELEVYQAS
ncbi:hypothetical protein [Flindersiella endophytica]